MQGWTQLVGIIVLAGLLGGCASAQVVSVSGVAGAKSPPAPRPAIVHVADFTLDPDEIAAPPLAAVLPFHAARERMEARSLVDTMSGAIVADLAARGIAADRLPAKGTVPQAGWLVRGRFTAVDEGSRLKRAVIGFGSGATDLAVDVAIDNLAAGAAPLGRLETDATSGKMPGAVVTLNPYVAAAKFVLAGHDLDRSTRQTAAKIADAIAARMEAPGSSTRG